MTGRRSLLLSATAMAALLGASSSGAMAFDEVNWTWNKLVDENVVIDINIANDLVPSGLVEVEKLQMHFGNINAKAKVEGIYNNAAGEGGEEGGVVVIDETFSFDTTYSDEPNPEGLPINSAVGTGGEPLTAELLEGGTNNENLNQLLFDIRVQGEIPFEDLDFVLDAADLPKIENAATAVANNQTIESDVGLYLHDAQFAAGNINSIGGFENSDDPNALAFLIGAALIAAVDEDLEGVNLHTDIAALLTVGAATGFIDKADIEAKAKVSDILNAYVENSATAVTNNASFSVQSDGTEPNIMIADLTQWGYADVTARAKVEDVTLNGYTGFGAAGFGGGLGEVTPIVSNTATAVGNNLNIKVGVPSP